MNICGKSLPPRAALLLTSDLVIFCGVLPFLLTSSFAIVTPPTQIYSSFALACRLTFVGVLCQVAFYYNEMYNLQALRKTRVMCENLLRGCGMLLLFLGVIYAAVPRLSPGMERLLILTLILLIISFVGRLLSLPKRRDRVMVIGADNEADEVCNVVETCPEWNMEVVQRTSLGNQQDATAALSELLAHPESVDGVIVCRDETYQSSLLQTLLTAKMSGVHVEQSMTFYERATGRVRMDFVQPDWFIFSSGFANGKRKRILKRGFDLLAACLLLVPALPVMAMVALAILIEGHGPILFVQNRIGLHKRPFRILKFRTMVPKEKDATSRWLSEEKNRITRLGQILRTFRLDELPQLFNVLSGDMSLVGPRPEQPHFCDLLEKHIPYYHQRHTVPPGLTGWAQVRYHYGDSIEESRRKTEFDLFYVKHLSLWLDLAVLIETVKVVLVGRGAR